MNAATAILAPDLVGIPAELIRLPQWVNWRLEPRPGETELTKVPYIAGCDSKASSTNPSTWATFEQAVAAYERGGYSGIGFVFTSDDPYTGVDLDKCRDSETGELQPWAARWVKRFATYWEVSPSGTGIKAWVRGRMPGDHHKRGQVEMYADERFFTMTGHRLDGVPATIEKCQDALDALYFETWPPVEPKPAARPTTNGGGPNPSDAALLDKMFAAVNGAAIQRLWSGDTSAYGGDDSRADQALCNHLAFYTRRDPAAMDRMFRQSDLMRSKWDERRGERTYGQRTIDTAIAGCSEIYTPSDGVRIITPSRNGHHTNGASGPTGPANAETTESPPRYPLTEYGNAERLVARYGRDLRYCGIRGKWSVWTGQRWAEDETDEVIRRMKSVVREIYREAANLDDADQRKSYATWAKRSEARSVISASIALAQSEPGIPITLDQFDADPWLLNVENGTLNLETGELQPHRREDLITRLAPATYNPTADCPRFLAFLNRIFNGNPDLIRFIQKAAGYSLTGRITERAMFILWGNGRNGKTTLVETLQALLADHAQRTPIKTILQKKEDGIPNDLARLKGARFVFSAEASEGRRLDEAGVKDLTGGDTITARFMRGEWFDFRPEFKLWLSTNHKPVIRGTDEAIWDRIRLIPFNVRIRDDEKDPNLADKLREELPGILNWTLAGCLAWQREGLEPPTEVREATAAYRQEMDVLGDFIEACCVIGDDLKASAKDLYAAYTGWCESNGDKPSSQRAFGGRLTERGFERRRGGATGAYWWHGIGLRGPNDPDPTERTEPLNDPEPRSDIAAEQKTSRGDIPDLGSDRSDRSDRSVPDQDLKRPQREQVLDLLRDLGWPKFELPSGPVEGASGWHRVVTQASPDVLADIRHRVEVLRADRAVWGAGA